MKCFRNISETFPFPFPSQPKWPLEMKFWSLLERKPRHNPVILAAIASYIYIRKQGKFAPNFIGIIIGKKMEYCGQFIEISFHSWIDSCIGTKCWNWNGYSHLSIFRAHSTSQFHSYANPIRWTKHYLRLPWFGHKTWFRLGN